MHRSLSSLHAQRSGGETRSTAHAEIGHYHRWFGRAVPELGWVPAPRYLLRRDLVLRMMRAVPIGYVLEIGCGAGALLEDLSRVGFRCDALETSVQARRVAQEVLKPRDGIGLHEQPQGDWTARFDVVLAFEVLEHIANDRDALVHWSSWLKPGGLIVISVPAHMKRWSPHDEWAGHCRRYERAGLAALFDAAGLQLVRLQNYGFPLGNLAAIARRSSHAKGAEGGPAELSDRTARSGIERSTEIRLWPLLSSVPGVLAMMLGMMLQRLFLASELGDGYLIVGRRP